MAGGSSGLVAGGSSGLVAGGSSGLIVGLSADTCKYYMCLGRKLCLHTQYAHTMCVNA